ncbi:MAG: hypothetical protein H7A41_01610 [Chlamydiales bacterium]|nr:hypothetical protein [Chlamydiales bacterium]
MLLIKERLAITLFFAILGVLITVAWITRENIDPEVESKVFSGRES